MTHRDTSLVVRVFLLVVGVLLTLSFSPLPTHSLTTQHPHSHTRHRKYVFINPHAPFSRPSLSPSPTGTRLQSLGDPDQSPRWRFLRWWQRTARVLDRAVLFPGLGQQDTDTPGWTFPSPVLWAPWMETVWLGNLYDYR